MEEGFKRECVEILVGALVIISIISASSVVILLLVKLSLWVL